MSGYNEAFLPVYRAQRIWIRPDKDQLPENVRLGTVSNFTGQLIKVKLFTQESIWLERTSETGWHVKPD